MLETGEQTEGDSPFGIFCVLPPCRLTAASCSIFSSNPRVCVSILNSSPFPYNRPLTCSQWREGGEPRGAFALKPRGHSPRTDPRPAPSPPPPASPASGCSDRPRPLTSDSPEKGRRSGWRALPGFLASPKPVDACCAGAPFPGQRPPRLPP